MGFDGELCRVPPCGLISERLFLYFYFMMEICFFASSHIIVIFSVTILDIVFLIIKLEIVL
jgi:hypothetical protein